jgi:hypothetical protein
MCALHMSPKPTGAKSAKRGLADFFQIEEARGDVCSAHEPQADEDLGKI